MCASETQYTGFFCDSALSLSKWSVTDDSLRAAYFCTFPVAFVGFAQALSGLPAARGGVEGRHHLTGSVTQASLYTIGVIQLLHLEEQKHYTMQSASSCQQMKLKLP